jgi:hypothetical protein
MQHNEQDRAAQAAYDQPAYAPQPAAYGQPAYAPQPDGRPYRDEAAQTYRQDGVELSRGIAPARYDELGATLVTIHTVTLRAAPDDRSERVGKLHRGERFEGLAQVRGSDWILVGHDGVGVGYVPRAFTRLDRESYAER